METIIFEDDGIRNGTSTTYQGLFLSSVLSNEEEQNHLALSDSDNLDYTLGASTEHTSKKPVHFRKFKSASISWGNNPRDKRIVKPLAIDTEPKRSFARPTFQDVRTRIAPIKQAWTEGTSEITNSEEFRDFDQDSKRRGAICEEIEKERCMVKINGASMSLYDLRMEFLRLPKEVKLRLQKQV